MIASFVLSVFLAGAITVSALSPAFAQTTGTTGSPPSGSRGHPVNSVTLCSDVAYGGVCQWFTQDTPNLIGTPVGNDSVSSLRGMRAGSAVHLFSDINFQGTCQALGFDTPSLFNTVIGNDRVSSFKFVSTSMDNTVVVIPPCPSRPVETKWFSQSSAVINHWASTTRTFVCPPDYPDVGDVAAPAAIPFGNRSSSNVSASLAGGGYGYQGIDVTFWNPNLTGDQTTNISLACHNG